MEQESAPSTPGFPAAVAELYKPLWQQVAPMHAEWRAYVRLFGTSENDLAILNRAAGTFIALVQHVLLSELILSISRVTDPRGSGERTNLSLEALVHAIDATTYPTLRQDLNACLTAANEATQFARDRRNRKVAHSDLKTALGTHGEPLPGYTRRQVNDALVAIATTLNTVSRHFNGGTTSFDNGSDPPGGAGVLIQRLRDGLALRDWRLSEKREGRPGIFPPEV